MAAADYIDVAQQLYVSYFGRPADPYGLDSYTKQLDALGAPKTIAELETLVASKTKPALNALVNSFNNSDESIKLYGNDNTQLGVSKFVAALYQNIFGREADVGGAKWWIDEIVSGRVTRANAALSITQGAFANTSDEAKKDQAAVLAKLGVAKDFTTNLDTIGEINAFSGEAAAAAARGLLTGVTSTTVVADYHATVLSTIDTIVTGSIPATNVALTLSQDSGAAFAGTAGNDVFTAGVALDGQGNAKDTLQNFDSLNGGAGNDTLNATLNGGTDVVPTLAGIENVNVRVTAAGSNLDLAAATGVTNVTLNNGVVAGTVKNVGAAAVGVKDQAVNATFTGSTATTLSISAKNAAKADGSEITVAVESATADAATTVNLAVDNSAVKLDSLNNDAYKTVNIAATGSNIVTLTDVAAVATTVAVTGAGSVDLSGVALTAVTSLTAATGALTADLTGNTATAVTVTTGAGADSIKVTGANLTSINTGAGNDSVTITSAAAATSTITLGDGDDSVTFTAAPSAGVTVSGGAGNDTIGFTSADYTTVTGGFTAPQLALITGFETLKITNALVNGSTTDVSKIAGVTNFVADAGVAAGGAASVTNLGANSNVTVKGGTAASFGVSTVAIAALTGTAAATDTYSITINGTTVTTVAAALADNDAVGAALVAAINANVTTGALVTAAYDTATDKITLTGKTAVALVVAGNGNVDGADASTTFTPAVVTAGTAAAAGGDLAVSLKTDTAADVLNLTLAVKYLENNDATSSTSAVTQKVDASLIETLNVVASGTASAKFAGAAGTSADKVNTTLDLTDNALVTLNVSGAQKLSFATKAGMTKLATIDASTNTGGVVIDGTNTDVATGTALTIKGSATAANTLTGSGLADTIIGGSKADTITGGLGADKLTGGAGNDTFVYTAAAQSTLSSMDIISDFSANTFGNGASGAAGTGAGTDATKWTGDVLKFTGIGAAVLADGVFTFVASNASDATTFLANLAAETDPAKDNAFGAALDSSSGKLYIDLDGNGVADTVIQLTGVTTITSAAFVLTA
ncbi:DUF4214 domain-containing protein [Massilia sp. NR 4-1]|uniref:DUF4214 domain-containing protein n=1 Tax=Massilia sp. NR 4-1 TaxID=1678028 RepID=UPI00067C83F3|nr:DUF4214 domain-containing protein [Massilia sp. NR 4-1]AKU24025.1 hypothetical protein ACZ75_23785 [Massilia sp. NR 4-1]